MRPGLALLAGLVISAAGLAAVLLSAMDLVGVLLIGAGVVVALAGQRATRR